MAITLKANVRWGGVDYAPGATIPGLTPSDEAGLVSSNRAEWVGTPSTNSNAAVPVMATTDPGGVVRISPSDQGRPVLGPSFVDRLNAKNPAESFRWRIVGGDSAFGQKLQVATALADGQFAVHEYCREVGSAFLRHAYANICSRELLERFEATNSDAEPDIYNAPEPGAGWTATTTTNPYTTVVGTQFTMEFSGTGFDFLTYCNNAGGAWRVTVDGVVWGQISVFDTVHTYHTRTGPRGLSDGSHVAVFEFLGADGVNTPSGTARGWIARAIAETPTAADLRSRGTLRATHVNDAYTPTIGIGIPGSNHEGAVSYYPTGSAHPSQFWPQHGGVGNTMTLAAQHVAVDGVSKNMAAPAAAWQTGYRIDVCQQWDVHHPSAASTITAHGTMRSAVTPAGYEFVLDLEWIEGVTITSGYGVMCPAQFADVCELNSGDVLDLSAHSGVSTVAARPGDSGWLCDPSHPYAVAWDVIDYPVSARLGRIGYSPDWCQVQSRPGANRPSKYYGWIAAENAEIPAGETMRFAARYKIGVKPV